MGIFDEDDDGAMDAEADLEFDDFCGGPAPDAAFFTCEGNGFMDLPPDSDISVSLPLAEDVDAQSTPSPESSTSAMSDGSAQATEESDEYAASPPKKRFRRSLKTADDSTSASMSKSVLDEARFECSSRLPKSFYPPIKFPSDTEWNKKNHRARWQWVFSKVRSFWGMKTDKEDREAAAADPQKQSRSCKKLWPWSS